MFTDVWWLSCFYHVACSFPQSCVWSVCNDRSKYNIHDIYWIYIYKNSLVRILYYILLVFLINLIVLSFVFHVQIPSCKVLLIPFCKVLLIPTFMFSCWKVTQSGFLSSRTPSKVTQRLQQWAQSLLGWLSSVYGSPSLYIVIDPTHLVRDRRSRYSLPNERVVIEQQTWLLRGHCPLRRTPPVNRPYPAVSSLRRAWAIIPSATPWLFY